MGNKSLEPQLTKIGIAIRTEPILRKYDLAMAQILVRGPNLSAVGSRPFF